MKTQIGRLAMFVALLITVLTSSSSWGQSTVITIYGGVIDRFASSATYASLINAIKTNSPQNADWDYFTNNSTISLTRIFNNGSSGGLFRNALVITSSVPFTLAQIQIIVENSVFPATFPSFVSYSNLGIGVDSGPDELLGTSDDITYTSDNGSTLVNAVWLRGAGRTINIENTPVNEALALWGGFTFERVTYTVNGVSATNQINLAVPDPDLVIANSKSQGTNFIFDVTSNDAGVRKFVVEQSVNGLTNWVQLNITNNITGSPLTISISKDTNNSVFFRTKKL